MADAQFNYHGVNYIVDTTSGAVREAVSGTPITGAKLDVPLQAAAAAATAGAGGATTLTGAPTTPGATEATPPPEVGPGAGAPVSLTAPVPAAAAPKPATTIPATPPRRGSGSAVAERTQRDAIQKEIDRLTAGMATSPTPSADATALTKYQAQLTDINANITKLETPPVPQIVSGPVTSKTKYIVHDNGDGTVSSTINPTWDGTTVAPQIVNSGNNIISIDPSTGKATVAYTNDDANTLANAQTRVAQSNANVAAAAAAANAASQKAKDELATRVANGDTAAEVRADLALEITRLHQDWVQADGDRKDARAQLDSVNTERHNVARDQLGEKQLAANAEQQARQDATSRRNQDVATAGNKYTTDVSARTARMQAGGAMLQGVLGMLTQINKDLPPGSDLAGKAFEGMMAYGQKMLANFAGPEISDPNAVPGAVPPGLIPPGAPVLPGQIDPLIPPPTDAAPVTPWTPHQAESSASAVQRFGPITDQGVEEYAANNNMNWDQARTTMEAAQPGASMVAAGFQAGAADPATTMAAQNAAAHNATMAAPVKLAPDGTPYASAAAVAAKFGREVTTGIPA